MASSIVYNMDCMEYMKSLPDKFFDLAVVDKKSGLDFSKPLRRTNYV